MASPYKSPEERVEHGDSFLDPDFFVDIGKKMTVPNKIKVAEPANYNELMEDSAIVAIQSQQKNAAMMQVPDCIRVAGGETHITTREPPPEMKYEDTLFGKPHDLDAVQLATPPRTLRYQDAVPIFAEPIKQLDEVLNASINNSTKTPASTKARMNDSLITEYEDQDSMPLTVQQQSTMATLRRRLMHLSQRIDSLEVENQNRNRRELFMYALGALYLLFRGLSYLAGPSRNRFTSF